VIKGDIVLIPFPFTNLTGVKNRPALVLISGQFDVTVSFITSQKSLDENDQLLRPTKANGLKNASFIRLSKIATIDKALVIGRLGTLSSSELHEVNQKLISILQLAESITDKS